MSWAAVAVGTILFFAALFAIVLRGSRLIDAQKQALSERVADLTTLLDQNETLRLRVQRASQRAAALNERFLRQIGSDLHDGPAQLIALASLKLDARGLTSAGAKVSQRKEQLSGIRSHLDDALSEIRALARGLVLPTIESAALDQILALAIDEYRQRSSVAVAYKASGLCRPVTTSEKICAYRFVQEGLNNGLRHAAGAGQAVELSCDGQILKISVKDEGPGFDPDAVHQDAIGLAGLRDRVESLGGQFDIAAGASGTTLTMTLTEMSAA